MLAAANTASGAQPALLDVLRQKAILTEDEYRNLQRAPAGDAALLELLKTKGILTAAEYNQVKSAQAQPAAPTVRTAAKPADGTVFEDRSAGLKVKVGGRLHADYRSYDARTTSRTTNTAEVRRARLGVELELGDWLDAEITGDFASTAKIDTAYVNYKLANAAQLRLGLFKMPFSLEEMTSSNFIDFQERSLANSQAPGKERGIMVHGRPAKGLYYGVALSNGNGDADTDDNDGKDRIGRLTANAAEWTGSKNAVLHGGIGVTRGSRPVGDVGFNGRTEARGFRFFDPAAFTGGPVGVSRNGIEAAFAWGPFKLQAEHIATRFDGVSAAGVAYDREIKAQYVSASWLVTGEHYADAYRNGAFRNIRPKSDFRAGSGGRGALELGLRYSRFDASDFQLTNPAGSGVLGAGLTDGADAWTLGLKWILNPYSRVMVNLVETRFDTLVTIGGVPTSRERALLLRGQVNF
ncbi:MAG: OprO/OprP family phosphate-selective porin [Burkholderiales bacterium]